ncbi:MAG: hypothetical protein J2P18_03945 [Nocardia sp.]|nr:hypothetical protein [Nocardia sp.]
MDHTRILRLVLGVTAGYLVVLAIWAGWVHGRMPPGTGPYQIVALVGAFGSSVGIAMMIAQRPTRSDRRLLRHGLEGWARIEAIHPLRHTDHHTELTELDLEFTVPGSETYRGTVVVDVAPVDQPRMHVGETISIRVDPADRDRVMFCM